MDQSFQNSLALFSFPLNLDFKTLQDFLQVSVFGSFRVAWIKVYRPLFIISHENFEVT